MGIEGGDGWKYAQGVRERVSPGGSENAASSSSSSPTDGHSISYAQPTKQSSCAEPVSSTPRTPTTWAHPTRNAPTEVAVVALGVTSRAWIDYGLRKGGPNDATPASDFDEVWTVNRGVRVFRHDVAWVMDDLIGEANSDYRYGQFLMRHPKPVITSVAYDSFTSSLTYPMAEVQAELGVEAVPYFHNSVPYIIAYALFIGVKRLILFGCDYTHPNAPNIREADRANCEYWVGFARARGMRVGVPQDSTLLNTRDHDGLWWYGYREQAIPLGLWEDYVKERTP